MGQTNACDINIDPVLDIGFWHQARRSASHTLVLGLGLGLGLKPDSKLIGYPLSRRDYARRMLSSLWLSQRRDAPLVS